MPMSMKPTPAKTRVKNPIAESVVQSVEMRISDGFGGTRIAEWRFDAVSILKQRNIRSEAAAVHICQRVFGLWHRCGFCEMKILQRENVNGPSTESW